MRQGDIGWHSLPRFGPQGVAVHMRLSDGEDLLRCWLAGWFRSLPLRL